MTTVYFAGGEDTSWLSTNGGMASGSGNRSAYSRGAMSIGTDTGSAYPPICHCTTPVLTPISSFWMHGQGLMGSTAGTGNNWIMLAYDNGGVGRIGVITGSGTNSLSIATRNAAGTTTKLVTSANNALVIGTVQAIDLFVSYGTSGRATLYVNGVMVADTGASVNVTTDSATALAQFLYGSHGSGGSAYWSECIIQDTTTLGCALQTLSPVAAGATQSWTPNTVGNVNPVAINDANYVSTATDNVLSEWTVTTTLPGGSWTIEAIVQEARLAAGTFGPQHFAWAVRTTDGTDHTTGTTPVTIGSFYNYGGQIWANNPHTSNPWLAADLINIGIESLA